MKLLQKTDRTYFIASGTAFIIAGVTFFFVINYFFRDQLNENLISDIKVVQKSIERNGILPNYYPFIEIREVSAQSEKSYVTIDTLIFDEIEKKEVPYRQISLVSSLNGKKYLIAARDTLLEEEDLMQAIAIVTGSVFILLLVSLYFINRRLSLNIWQPFYIMLDELKGFSYDKPGFRLSSVSQPDEFSELNKTLEKLTRKVISDYQSLKRFAEDASHEIQTPLAVIQSKLETLMQFPDLKKDQAELLNAAYVYTLRISKLTKTLLLLTKIANDQFPEKRKTDLSELLEEKINIFEDHISEKSLGIIKEIEPQCFFETNIFLAESLIINLVDNAVKHSIKGGVINIKLDKIHLEISNRAKPSPVPASKFFDRFYKSDKLSDSPGLGLSIVREICRLNKWDIKYEIEDDFHKVIINF